MTITDTHTHLYHRQFHQDRKEVVERAIAAGVSRLFLPNIDADSVEGMLQLAEEFPANCFPMMGLHPCSVAENWEEQLAPLRGFLYAEPDRYAAVGEIGIDLYWDKSTYPWQKAAFQEQIRWALELDKPIVIHSRESFDEVFEAVEEVRRPGLKGILHCFTGTSAHAERALGLGLHLGIGGVLTYKNSDLRDVLKEVDMKHLVLETDSPYLAPVPHRGKRNESAYTLEVAQVLAAVKGISVEEVARVTTHNSLLIFGR